MTNLKTADEIFQKEYEAATSKYGYSDDTIKTYMVKAMEEYASQFKTQPLVNPESEEELWKEVAEIIDYTPDQFVSLMYEKLSARYSIARK